jgi:hypothetical protein
VLYFHLLLKIPEATCAAIKLNVRRWLCCLDFLIYKYPCQVFEHNWLDNLRSLAGAPVAGAHLFSQRHFLEEA